MSWNYFETQKASLEIKAVVVIISRRIQFLWSQKDRE